MERIWQKHFGNMPFEVDYKNCGTVADMFDTAIAEFGDKPAFHCMGKSLTYDELDQHARNFSAYLQSTLGLHKGDRVAIMLPNLLTFPVASIGIIRAGLIQVNVNPLYTPRELAHQLNDADTDTIVVFSQVTPTLAAVLGQTKIKNIITVGLDDLINMNIPSPPVHEDLVANSTAFTDALDLGVGLAFDKPELTQDDLVYLQYTGGTTGLSKGAMLSHGNLIANIAGYEIVAGEVTRPGQEIIITALPLYHIFALMVNMLSYFRYGAQNVLIPNPRDMPGFVKEWSKWKATAFCGVNTLFNGLVHTPGFADIDFSDLRVAWGGGAPVQQAISEKWKAVTGKHIKEGYGLSETSPVLTMNPVNLSEFNSTIGIPYPSTDISIRDDDGQEVAIGEAGELCAKGPQVMQGYWRQPEATTEVTTDDGYFRTGDIAVCDQDGFFKIVDRKKDMILVSGFNVYPAEIEAVLAAMDGVMEAACIGTPDEKTGEAVKAFIVGDDKLTPESVTAYCRDNLAAYKVPHDVIFLKELPKSTVGKILRRELRS